MANLFLDTDWVAMKSLYRLKNKLSVASGFNTDYNKEFTKPFAINDTCTIKYPQRFIGGNGLAYTPEALNRRGTTVVLDQLPHVHFDWDSYEAAVKMERGEEQITTEYIDPAMDTLAQIIDSLAAQFAYKNSNNIVGILGTNPATFDACSGAARQRLVELACPPTGDKMMVVTPAIMRTLKAASIALLNPVQTISKQARTGIITEKQDDFDWYESMSLYSHTAGTWAGAVSVNTTATDGASTLVVTCTSGDTFLAGDVFNVAGSNAVNPMTRRSTGTRKQFVVLADVTATTTSATLSISPSIYGPGSQYQNVDVFPTAGQALTLFPGTTSPNGLTGSNSLAFHGNAFAMVSVDLEKPRSAEMASQKRDPQTGISIRFTRTWDAINSRMINRFDCLLGFGRLYSDECAVRVLGA